MPGSASSVALADFALFDGGPFSKFQAALGLAGTEHRHVRRNIIVAVLLTWVPLAVLAAIQGRAIALDWHKSMLLDVAMYARFLVALPLLIAATPGLRRRLQTVVPQFLEAELVKEPERRQFLANVTAMLRWRDSFIAAAVLVLLAAGQTAAYGMGTSAGMPGSWRYLDVEGGRHLSLAGLWLLAISHPLYQLVVLQFLYRLLLWWLFLWRTSRLDLDLNAAHPDGAGGLAFLAMVFTPFRLPLFAIAASAAGALANLILWTGAPFMDFKTAIGACVAVQVALVAGPLLFFGAQLRQVRNRGMLSFSASAGRQLRAFKEKWLTANPPAPSEMLCAPDFSAVSGYGQTAAVAKMSKLPFSPRQLMPLIVAALLPFLPVAAMQIPLKEILAQVWKLIA